MVPNQSSPLGAVRGAMLYASGKRCNAADGLIWPTEGREIAPPGLRCAQLMVPPAPLSRTHLAGDRDFPVKWSFNLQIDSSSTESNIDDH